MGSAAFRRRRRETKASKEGLARVATRLIALVSLLAGACTHYPGPTREVVVVARGMSFVLENEPDVPNPVIPVRAGERVRLVLRNEAPGLLHDIVIPELRVEIEQIREGETRDVIFTAPSTPGRYQYKCRPHASMMQGFLEITP